MKVKKDKPKKDSQHPADKPLIKSANLFPVVGIGASAGGLDAFKRLLKAIPENSGMAYVLVQHLDPNHESMLPELLQKVTNIPVLEIADDIKVEPNHIYVIPSNKMMVATDGVLLLAVRPAKSKTERNLPIDLFFKSLAEVHQSHAIGVVLSGTASDGTLGLKAIKDHGGITFAQDEESAAYEGMPHSAIQAGVVDFILPPEKIPQKLLEVTKIINGNGNGQNEENLPLQDKDVFKQILSLLRIRKGTDFTYYKQSTIHRRILRRMALNKNEEPATYLKYLRENKQEQDVLYQDLLIPVTSFFRDKKSFDNLCENVFPILAKNKTAGEPIRVWVAGCSTGEEAYSIAICLKEFLGEAHHSVQIFATDLSEPAIIKARHGIYTKTELNTVTEQRLQEFFTKNNGSYQVNKNVRDMCVFAQHNFLKDPPFGKIDFISCRNVLIYMEPYLQKKALTTFHYSLNPKGFLLLGKSETTSGVPDLFIAAAKNDKLFSRKDVPGRFMHVASQRSEQNFSQTNASPSNETIRPDFQKTADDIMLRKYTPAGVVVNEAMDIVHFRGNTGSFLEQSPGKPTHNLLQMAKNGLAFELRNILHKAKKVKAPVIKENIPLEINGNLINISIEAMLLPNTIEPHYLILFHNDKSVAAVQLTVGNKKTPAGKTKKDDKYLRIQLLEQELAQTREDMRSITEDQEAANEELQSANEELLSSSEELQSLNEELETGKEELQSTNEELTVVNQEIISLNERVTAARDYAEAIITTIREPLLVLNKNLRVISANNSFYKTFQVIESETEGRLIYDLGNRQWNIPELRKLLEEILPQKTKLTDFEVSINLVNTGDRVMLLNASEIIKEKGEEKLILLAIEDVTEKVSARKKIEDTCERYHNILMESPFAFSIMTGKEMVITHANKQIKEFWGKGDEVEGKTLLEVLPELADQPFPAMLHSVFTTGKPVYANEILARLNHNGKIEERYFNIVYQPHLEADETISGVITIAHEVTNEVVARKKIEASEFRYHNMVYSSPSLIAIFKGEDMIIEIANDAVLESWGKGKDIIGKSIFRVIPETVEQGFDKLLLSVYKTGQPVHAYESPVTLLRNGSKELVYYNFIYQAQHNVNGEIEGVAIIATEVTPQALFNKKIKASEEKFRLLVLQAPVAICVMRGENYLIEVINKGMYEMWDRTLEQVLDKPAFEVLTELRDQGFKELIDNVYKTGERFVADEFPINLRRNGKLESAFVKFIYEPLREADGSISGVMALAHEITEQILSRKKIEENETKFRSLIEEAPVATCLFTGREMTIEVANDIMIGYWGKGKNVIGKPLADAVPELKGQPFLQILDDVFTTGKTYHSNNARTELKIDGVLGTYYFDYTYKPIRNAAGEVYGIMDMAVDVSEQVIARKRIEESESHFRTMSDLMPQKIWTADMEGNYNYFNKCWLDYSGLDFEELKDLGWKKVIHPNDWEETIRRWQESIDTGENFEMEHRFRNTEGVYKWHLSRGLLQKDENGHRKIWIGTNTEMHHIKEEEQRKGDFIKMVSHELKTPVTSIKGYVQLLLMMTEDEQQKQDLLQIKSSLFRIDYQVSRLARLITEMLDLSRIETGKLELQNELFSINDLVIEAVEDIRHTSTKHTINIHHDVNCTIKGDKDRIEQVIINFLGNAIKYSPDNNQVEIRIGNADNNQVAVSVTDYGIGIDPTEYKKIFERFYRVSGKNEQTYPGFGIGLFIAKAIIEKHHGFITIESEKGKGSVFTFTLPISTENNL